MGRRPTPSYRCQTRHTGKPFSARDLTRILCNSPTHIRKEFKIRLDAGEGCIGERDKDVADERIVCYTASEFGRMLSTIAEAEQILRDQEAEIDTLMEQVVGWADLALTFVGLAGAIKAAVTWVAGAIAKRVGAKASVEAASAVLSGAVKASVTAKTVFARDNMVEVLLKGGLKAEAAGMIMSQTGTKIRFR